MMRSCAISLMLCAYLSTAFGQIIAIDAGYEHSMALRADGKVFAWGGEYDGVPGSSVIVPSGLSTVNVIAAGGYYSIAAQSDGTIVHWGDEHTAVIPDSIDGSAVKVLSGGGYHVLAQKNDSTVTGWGYTGDGSLAVPAGLKAAAISAGFHWSCALRSDSTIAAWAATSVDGDVFLNVPSDNDVIAVSAGRGHGLAIKKDSTVISWGSTDDGKRDVPAGLKATVVAAGENFSVAARADGTVVQWGNAPGAVPDGLSGVIALATGRRHILALKSDGSVVAWGENDRGQCSVPTDATGVAPFRGLQQWNIARQHRNWGLFSAHAASYCVNGRTAPAAQKQWQAVGVRLYRNSRIINHIATATPELITEMR